MSHLPPDDEISVNVFNEIVKQKDKKGICKELSKSLMNV